MPITDYNASAASNTVLGTIPVGPNMERNKVNDAFQQLMADIAPYKYGLVQAKNVKDFGATGDGTTNDATALQAALNSGVLVVIFPPGTYKITTGLVVPANVWIEGNGATIVSTMTGASKAINFVNGGGARNLKLTGPGGTTYGASNNGIDCSGTNNSPGAPTYVTAPTLENVEVSGFGDYGIRFQYAIDAVSTNINVHDCGRVGVAGLSCEDVWIHGYHCSDIGPGTGGDAYGVFFDRLETGNETVEPRSYRCGVIGFHIENVNASGRNGQGVDSHAGVDILFSDGVITNCDVGGAFTSSNISGSPALAPIRCRAKNITINGGHNGYGFIMVGALSGGSIVQYAVDCELDLNLTGHGNDSVSVTDGSIAATLIRGTKGLRVRGNFKENESACIYLDRDNYAFNIQGSFTDPHTDNFAAPSCVRVVGNNNKGYIAGTFRYETAGLGTYVAVNSVRIESGLTGLDLDFGPSSFDGIDATHLTFTASTTTGVRYTGMMTQSANATIAVTSGGADGILDVTFAKRFPYVPNIMVTLDRPFNGGGKFPIIGVDQSGVVPTATGFRIYALPYDGTTWSGTGNITFRYLAQ